MSNNGHNATFSTTATANRAQDFTAANSKVARNQQGGSVQAQTQSQSQSHPQIQSQLHVKSQQHHHQQQHYRDHQSATDGKAQSTTPSIPNSTLPRPSDPFKTPTPTTVPNATKALSPTSTSILPIPIPRPLKRLFDRYPLVTYAPNELPVRAPLDRRRWYRHRGRQYESGGKAGWREDGQGMELRLEYEQEQEQEQEHKLYMFTSEEGAKQGWPSFNPGCLKWQTYLRFQGIRFQTLKSDNHASPNGILPFVVPAGPRTMTTSDVPISSGGLKKWADGQDASAAKVTVGCGIGGGGVGGGGGGGGDSLVDARHDAYMTLITLHIRRAWLYNLYLNPLNFAAVAYPHYIQPTSSNTLLQASISSTLRSAATTELLKQDTSIGNSSTGDALHPELLFEQADEAFEALAVRLDSDGNKWLSGRETPGLADATLFAYTHLLLDEGMGWADETLVEMVKAREGRESVVRHRDRILELYYCRKTEETEERERQGGLRG